MNDTSPIPLRPQATPAQIEQAGALGVSMGQDMLDFAFENHTQAQCNLNAHKLKVASKVVLTTVFANEIHYGKHGTVESVLDNLFKEMRNLLVAQIEHLISCDEHTKDQQ